MSLTIRSHGSLQARAPVQSGHLSLLAAAAGMGRQPGAGGAAGEVRQTVRVGKLNLVDLAGSERVHITGATGAHPLLLRGDAKPWLTAVRLMACASLLPAC